MEQAKQTFLAFFRREKLLKWVVALGLCGMALIYLSSRRGRTSTPRGCRQFRGVQPVSGAGAFPHHLRHHRGKVPCRAGDFGGQRPQPVR